MWHRFDSSPDHVEKHIGHVDHLLDTLSDLQARKGFRVELRDLRVLLGVTRHAYIALGQNVEMLAR